MSQDSNIKRSEDYRVRSLKLEEGELAGHPEFHRIIRSMQELHAAKNADYADGMKEGPLGNFNRTSSIQRLYPGMDWSSPFGVAMSYMLKQLDAAFVLKSARKESVTGEPVKSRLFDIAVYSVLGIILDEEERLNACSPQLR
jgi:hypothetical protein